MWMDTPERTMHDDAVQAARDAYAALLALEQREADRGLERCAYCGSGPATYHQRGDLYLCRACGREESPWIPQYGS